MLDPQPPGHRGLERLLYDNDDDDDDDITVECGHRPYLIK